VIRQPATLVGSTWRRAPAPLKSVEGYTPVCIWGVWLSEWNSNHNRPIARIQLDSAPLKSVEGYTGRWKRGLSYLSATSSTTRVTLGFDHWFAANQTEIADVDIRSAKDILGTCP